MVGLMLIKGNRVFYSGMKKGYCKIRKNLKQVMQILILIHS